MILLISDSDNGEMITASIRVSFLLNVVSYVSSSL